MGEISGLTRRLDPRMIQKIHQLVAKGVSSTREMERSLKLYVEDEVFRNKTCPSFLDRQWFPKRKDIRNHMSAATKKLRLSSCDQQNLALLIEEWKRHTPSDSFFYRKHHTTDTETKEFLYVHQTAWQKQMLNKYGNHLFLLDATYKTSRYSLPLFFLCVKTNVNYQIVGSFIIQRETQISIFEALQILSSWNPGWIPSNAMCDFSNEEIKAIEELFPGKLSACF